MPGESLRYAPFHRDNKNIRVTVILGIKGDKPSVGRKNGIGFDPVVRGQTTDVSPIDIGNPYIARINKGNVVFAYSRLAQ